jgi:superfamily II DNA or RNA helicase
MNELKPGLYEQLVTESLEAQLDELDARRRAIRGRLHGEEAADRIALYLGELVRRAISGLDAKQRTSIGLDLAKQIVHLLSQSGKSVDSTDAPSVRGDVLQAIAGLQPDGTQETIQLPATPLLDTTLLTNAPGEPRIGFQLQSEVPSADRIDILMAFVRKSGIQPFLDLLKEHRSATRPLRVLTTTYTGSTELSALQALRDLGADIRVSYDVSSTRLHAKAWLFHRSSGYSTAYIGSSNLTYSAQVTGAEWNVRVSGARNPDVIEKFSAVFDSYWNNEDYRTFDEAEFRELTQVQDKGPRIFLSPVEIRLEPFQARLLEQIELSRLQGRHRNLLVSATGTGKTVMAAMDYQRLRSRLSRSRLLFVAHRKEILEQSLATFRHALRDESFGELWVGGARPLKFEHVFASVQSLTASGVDNLVADHFDVVVIDEFHHAAANTYRAILDHLNPVELLALTATPERSDEEPILQWFEGRIAAELRLWDAIDQHRLCPFAYYGISDGLDYRRVSWRRGRGYDPQEMSNLVTGDQVLARLILSNVARVVPNFESMRALGFCVSVAHAQFMADQFCRAGVAAVAVWAETPEDDRRKALQDLAGGRIRAVFSVDLFNEGVDIPSVDTLLLLRPTDSPTVFLQQLGRGLRRENGKTICTVLDFIGRHRKEFQFHRRFGALLGGTRKQLEKQVERGFPFLPSGCHLQLDAVATVEVLENIRQSLPATWPAKARELCRVAETSPDVTLKRFLHASGLGLEDIYSNNHCWSDLLESGGLQTLPRGPEEDAIRRALGRLLHIDDDLRIRQYRAFAQAKHLPAINALPLRDRRLFHMLAAVLTESASSPCESLDEAAALIWEHPQVLIELDQLMEVLADRIDHVQTPLRTHPDAPLHVHARYTRREILAAFGNGDSIRLAEWREGARWIEAEKVDLLAFTLDKTTGHFSPTTRYRDYAISRELLHWESQSGTRAESVAGRRYQRHQSQRNTVLPFARLTTDDRAFWLLGPANYVSHEGERPMAITWRLDHLLPGDLYARFGAAVS